MAVLLSGTTIGGHVAVHANNISTYALTSVPSNVITTSGGQTIAGITYFSNGESLSLYGIRGRFTNEYIHLYHKVGIGHPSGWGQGEGNTPGYGLSTYGGMNIAYGRDNGATINTYTRINKNWGGGDYSAEQLTIRGTYPSITLRSTQHNSKWLIHHASALQFYYGGTVDDNNWANKFEIPTDGNIWMAWANANISTLLDAKQNASTAITTSNIGSQSVASASQVSGVSVSATEMNRLKTTLGATGLPYSCDIYVEGDPNTYYPVHFIWGDQDVWRRIIIKRGYSEEAPWDPKGTGAHHGGLLLDWEGNFGEWGGAEYSDRLRVFNESYTNVCADMYIYTHGMGYVFMLRGGHALYHIFSDQEIRGFHQVGTPDIAYDTNTKFYDSSTDAYDVYAPAPVTTINSSRIDGLRTKKQSLFDGRYQQISTAINTSNIGSQSVNYATTAGTSTHTYRGIIEDTRAGQRTPNAYEDYRVSWEFTNQMPHDGNWLSVMTMRGWHDEYAAWQIMGTATTAAYESWYLRSGVGTSWNTAKEIIHSGNIASQSVSYAVTSGTSSATTQTNFSSLTVEGLDVATREYVTSQGYLTSLPSHNHDDRYYTESESDGRFQPLENQRLRTSDTVRFSNTYTSAWFRNDNSNTGLYNEATTMHLSSNENGYWDVSSTNSVSSIRFYTGGHKSALRGYVYANTSNEIGFLNNAGDWSLKTDSSKNTHIYNQLIVGNGQDASSIQMYDSDEGTRYIYCNSNRIGFLTQAGGWGSWCYDDGSWATEVAMYSPIYYDSADTGYYLDPNGQSRIYRVNISEGQVQAANNAGGRLRISSFTNGESVINGQTHNIVLGPYSTRAGANLYYAGIAINGLMNYTGGTAYDVAPHIWLGGYYRDTPGSERSDFVVAIKSGVGTSGAGSDLPEPRFRVDYQGIASATGSFRAPIFYSSIDTNYFWEPNVSNAHRLRTANGYVDIGPMNGSWCHFQTDRANFYFGSTIYADASGFATYGGSTSMTKTDINSPIFLVPNHSDNTKGYRIYNTSNSSVSAMFVNSSNQLVIAAGAVDQINLNKKVYVNGVALGVNVAPSATAGRIDASNDIVAYSSSDERLKYNIAPIENALDKVKSLTGVEFDWKPEYKHAHGYEGHDTGIIAQQVQDVMPSAVRTNDTGFLAVRYEKLIGLLIEGMKEQQAQIDELKAKLDGLAR